jgi:hypothetical protein
MIIDPSRTGCTVWMGNKFQILTGSIDECCERIIKFITRDISEESYVDCFNFINFKKSNYVHAPFLPLDCILKRYTVFSFDFSFSTKHFFDANISHIFYYFF